MEKVSEMLAALTKTGSKIKRLRLEISGVVQGVGFRPFVFSAAKLFDVKGFVGNESKGVFIEIEGGETALNKFVEHLKTNAPPLAHISRISSQIIEIKGETDFQIIESESHEADFTLISPDISICADCLQELFDPQNRRYLYPLSTARIADRVLRLRKPFLMTDRTRRWRNL